MKNITTRTHGFIDYANALGMISAPMAFGFAGNGPETAVPVALGAGVALYSLLTDYEMGAARLIPMKTHLALDIAGGLLLAASPWLFGFKRKVWIPHVAVGLTEVAVALATEMRPRDREANLYEEMEEVITGASEVIVKTAEVIEVKAEKQD